MQRVRLRVIGRGGAGQRGVSATHMSDIQGSGKSGAMLDAWLARRAVRPLARTSITPNMLTLLGLLAGLLAGWLFSRGDSASAHWGGAVFVFAAWMDHVDGEHARATGQTSTFGHYFDHVGAMTTYLSMFIGIGIGSHDISGQWAAALGISAGISVIAIFSVRMWCEVHLGPESVRQPHHSGFEIEDTLYIVGPVAWFGLLKPFLIAAGIGAPLFLVWVVYEAMRHSRVQAGSGQER